MDVASIVMAPKGNRRGGCRPIGTSRPSASAAIRARIQTEHGPFIEGDAAWYAWIAPRLYRFGLERPTREVLEAFLGGPVSPAALLADMRRMRQAGMSR